MIQATTEAGAGLLTNFTAAAHELTWISADQHVPDTGDLVFTTAHTYEAFSTLTQLVDALIAHHRLSPSDVQAQVAAHRRAFAQLLPHLVDEPLGDDARLTREGLAGSRLVRRIGRESIRFTDAIDNVARFVVGLLDHPNAPRRLVMLHAQRLDRPSARVLHRVCVLVGSPLRWAWTFTAAPSIADAPLAPHERRFHVARHRLFDELTRRLTPDVALDGLPSLRYPGASFGRRDATLQDVGYELQQQNFERAYLMAGLVLESAADGDAAAHVYRLLGTVDANVGTDDLAEESGHTALRLAHSPLVRAQCAYMLGLFLAKRRYDLTAAEQAYTEGLQGLVSCGEGPELRIERAWLANGLALTQALRCRTLPPSAQRAALERLYASLAGTYKTVAAIEQPEALYLKLNLLANMTLLLEALGEYAKAAYFWSSVFERYCRGTTDDALSFRIAHAYRLGMLRHKAGEHRVAEDHLRSALTLCDVSDDRFAEERLRYALGAVLQADGRASAAFAEFERGYGLARELRLAPAAEQHLTGMRAAALELKDFGAVHAAEAALARVPGFGGHFTSLTAPVSKFPSYVRMLDLESAERPDLNTYLVAPGVQAPISAVAP